jgi:hypothetical protein
MAFTDIDNSELYFQTKLYTGNGTAIGSGGLAVTLDGDEDMQPDLVWIKNRDGTDWHDLYDSVRGVTKRIYSNSDYAEGTQAEGLTAFGTNGFTVGNSGDVNTNTNKHVAWNWKAGTSFSNDASATSIGTIDSSGSVNTDAGFSIVSYTGTGSAGTIKHGLSTAPKMILFKKRDSTKNWITYDASNGAGKYLTLNATDAVGTSSTVHNDTEPTSSVFSVGTNSHVNTSSATYIAYCFADVKGYSKVGGSYTGNGNADGTFVYTGFRPAFVMVKPTSRTGRWRIKDNKRDIDNVMDKRLSAEDSDAEGTGSTEYIDFLSNGFKARASEGQWNGDGETNIYIAFAEAPFVNSNGVPCNAR